MKASKYVAVIIIIVIIVENALIVVTLRCWWSIEGTFYRL